MKCPSCDKETTFILVDVADDYQDGEIECSSCGVRIGSFSLYTKSKGGK